MKRMFRDDALREILFDEEKQFTNKVGSFLSLYNPQVAGGVYHDLANGKNPENVSIDWIFDEDGNPTEEIGKGESYWVVLSSTTFQSGTPFKASDGGWLELEDGTLVCVINVKQLPSGWILHQITVRYVDISFLRASELTMFCIGQICYF
jgi:alanyl-tRNA synthetase